MPRLKQTTGKFQMLYHSYREYYYSSYINQQKHWTKHNSWQVLKSYMFRHRGAIHRSFYVTKEYKPNNVRLEIAFPVLESLE